MAYTLTAVIASICFINACVIGHWTWNTDITPLKDKKDILRHSTSCRIHYCFCASGSMLVPVHTPSVTAVVDRRW